MHSRGWAHMDIKPHNVLIRSPRQQQSNSKVPAAPGHQNMSVAQFEDDDADADGEAGTSLVSWHDFRLQSCDNSSRMALYFCVSRLKVTAVALLCCHPVSGRRWHGCEHTAIWRRQVIHRLQGGLINTPVYSCQYCMSTRPAINLKQLDRTGLAILACT